MRFNRVFLWILLSSVSVGELAACDICGCSSGNHSLGVMPLFARHFVGLRYSYRAFSTQHPSGMDPSGWERSREHFHSIDLRVRYQPHHQFQLLAQLPFRHFIQTKDAETVINTGFGDMLLLGNVVIFNNGDSTHLRWRHALQGGVGIKAPTGQWQSGSNMNPNLQLGSGSWDIPLYLSYTLRHRRGWGLLWEAGYSVNTANKEDFRFGNALNADMTAFYTGRLGKWSLMPSLGLSYMNLQDNRSQGRRRFDTGGNLLTAQVGLQVFFRKIALGASARMPLYQGLSSGQVKAQPQWQVQCLVFI